MDEAQLNLLEQIADTGLTCQEEDSCRGYVKGNKALPLHRLSRVRFPRVSACWWC